MDNMNRVEMSKTVYIVQNYKATNALDVTKESEVHNNHSDNTKYPNNLKSIKELQNKNYNTTNIELGNSQYSTDYILFLSQLPSENFQSGKPISQPGCNS